jgi:hypothetical protein
MRLISLISICLIYYTSPMFSDENKSVVTLLDCYDQGHALTDQDIHSGYNASASIDLSSGLNCFAEGSGIYWKASENGLPLGVTSTPAKIYDIESDYHLGFKSKVGFHSNSDFWNFAFSYLFLHTKGHTEKLWTNSTSPHEFWYFNDITLITDYLSGKWKLEIDIMDLTFSRPFYLGLSVTMEPYTAVRGGWINQKYSAPSYIISTNNLLKNKTSSDSYLIGARGGLRTNWIFFNYFRMFGDIGIALLYQKFKLHNYQESLVNSLGLQSMDTKKEISNITPNIEASLGLGMGTYFFEKRWHLDLTVSYDFSVFFNQNTLSYFSNIINETSNASGLNNLMIHGFTGTLRLDF